MSGIGQSVLNRRGSGSGRQQRQASGNNTRNKKNDYDIRQTSIEDFESQEKQIMDQLNNDQQNPITIQEEVEENEVQPIEEEDEDQEGNIQDDEENYEMQFLSQYHNESDENTQATDRIVGNDGKV